MSGVVRMITLWKTCRGHGNDDIQYALLRKSKGKLRKGGIRWIRCRDEFAADSRIFRSICKRDTLRWFSVEDRIVLKKLILVGRTPRVGADTE